jgi:beta-N-acetylhexosaminidase
MKALTMSTGEAAVRAVAAGCDVLLVCSRSDLAELAHEALVHEAERSPTFRARCEEAFARSVAMRRRVPPSPVSDERDLALTFLASQPVIAELRARLAPTSGAA